MEFKENITDLDIFNKIKKLEQQGVQLYLDGSKLKYRALKKYFDKNILHEVRNQKDIIIQYLDTIKKNTVELSSLQLAYMTGQSEGQILNGVNAHYYIEYEKEDIDIERLQNVINLLISNNDALRLVLLSSGKGLILKNIPKYVVKSYIYENKEDRLNIRREFSHKKYSFETWPMFSFIVGKSIKVKDVLHISFDCSILDAWSASNMIDKLFKLYDGKTIEFSKYTYKSYMEDLERYKKKDVNKRTLNKANEYWKQQVEFIPKVPSLKMKKKIEELNTTTFTRQEHMFSADITVALEKLAKEQKVTLSSIIMTVYMKVLSYFSGGENITINATLFGKLPVNKEVGSLLGEFTNIGLIQYKDENKSFLESIKETQKQIFKLLEFRIYDGVNIIKKVYDKNHNSTGFPVVVTCMIGEIYKSKQNGFLETYSLSQTPQVIVDHHIRIIDGRIKISFDYIEELFEENYIKKIIQKYVEIIENISKA